MNEDWTNDATGDDFGNGENGYGDLSYLQSYEPLEVDKAILDIGSDAINLVTKMCHMYLKNELISDEDHVAAIAAIEINQLSSAMMAVRSVEHALATLMRQLDAGGYVDPDIFNSINTLSKTSMDLTIKASSYIRSLPEFLKFTAEEMQEQGIMQTVEIIQQGATATLSNTIDDAEYVQEAESFSKSGPISGTRALMMQIRDEETNLDQLIEDAKEQQKQIEEDNLKLDDEEDFNEFEQINPSDNVDDNIDFEETDD